jgi:hypothetical protein
MTPSQLENVCLLFHLEIKHAPAVMLYLGSFLEDFSFSFRFLSQFFVIRFHYVPPKCFCSGATGYKSSCYHLLCRCCREWRGVRSLQYARDHFIEVQITDKKTGSSATVGTGLPGRFGVDYAFINESAIDIYVDSNKVNLFRVAFLLERMCPVATGLGSTFNETVRVN